MLGGVGGARGRGGGGGGADIKNNSTWTPKVCRIIAFWAIIMGLGPLFYILSGVQVAVVILIGGHKIRPCSYLDYLFLTWTVCYLARLQAARASRVMKVLRRSGGDPIIRFPGAREALFLPRLLGFKLEASSPTA